MPKHLSHVLLAAIIAGALFIAVFGIGLGFIFMFLPTLPLFALGLGRQPSLALNAALAACLIISLAGGLPGGLLFLLFLGLPAWYWCRESLRWRGAPEAPEWMPVGLVITRLTLCACAAIALMTLYYITQPGGLPHLLSQNVQGAFSDLHDDYGTVINKTVVDELADRWAFLIFSVTIWLWGLALYAHAWLVNRVLAANHRQLRPGFAVEVFELPHWLPSLLAICALASLIGSPSMSFLGKTTLIALLLPYFFQGAALMHQASRHWPNRRLFLIFTYFMIFAQFWPALILSGIGLIHQIKRLSESGSWFKS